MHPKVVTSGSIPLKGDTVRTCQEAIPQKKKTSLPTSNPSILRCYVRFWEGCVIIEFHSIFTDLWYQTPWKSSGSWIFLANEIHMEFHGFFKQKMIS